MGEGLCLRQPSTAAGFVAHTQQGESQITICPPSIRKPCSWESQSAKTDRCLRDPGPACWDSRSGRRCFDEALRGGETQRRHWTGSFGKRLLRCKCSVSHVREHSSSAGRGGGHSQSHPSGRDSLRRWKLVSCGWTKPENSWEPRSAELAGQLGWKSHKIGFAFGVLPRVVGVVVGRHPRDEMECREFHAAEGRGRCHGGLLRPVARWVDGEAGCPQSEAGGTAHAVEDGFGHKSGRRLGIVSHIIVIFFYNTFCSRHKFPFCFVFLYFTSLYVNIQQGNISSGHFCLSIKVQKKFCQAREQSSEKSRRLYFFWRAIFSKFTQRDHTNLCFPISFQGRNM